MKLSMSTDLSPRHRVTASPRHRVILDISADTSLGGRSRS